MHSQNCVQQYKRVVILIERARTFLRRVAYGIEIDILEIYGDVIGFIIVSKDHTLVRSSYLSSPPCVHMPDYCFRSEKITLGMKSDDDQYHLSITLQVHVRGSESNWIQRDGMSIRDLELPTAASIFYLSLYQEMPSSTNISSYYVLGEDS